VKIFAFEGADGCGKTTTVEAVAAELRDMGFKVKTVCWLYDGVKRDPSARAMWYIRRMRDWHVLESKHLRTECYDFVLMDRSWISTLAYQGCLMQCNDVETAISTALQTKTLYRPDLVFRLPVPYKDALDRVVQRGEIGEHETLHEAFKLHEIYRKVIPAFLTAHSIPMAVLPIGTVEKVRDTVIDHIIAMLQPKFFSKPVDQV
jgi:thymidylate kinase